MKTFKAFFIVLIIVLFISSVKSQWIPCQGIEGMSCESIAIQDTFLFIADNGIFRKSINAPAWEPASFIYNVWKVRSTGSALFSYGGNVSSSFFRSLDNGLTWSELNLDYEYQNIETAGNAIIIDTYPELYRSLDDGNSWTVIHPSPETADIEWIYSQDTILYCYLENVNSLFLSYNYGDSWDTYPLSGITGSAGQPWLYNQNLWLCSRNKFYKFNSLMQEWILQQDTLPASSWISAFIEDDETLCCYTSDGYYRYNAQTAIWEDESQGLESRFCRDACRLNNTIYLATKSGPFIKEGNNSWLPYYNDLFGVEVSQAFIHDSKIYALAKNKIFSGSIEELNFEPLETQGYIPSNKIIAHNLGWISASNSGCLISTDTGFTWTDFSNGIENKVVIDIARTNPYYFAMIYGEVNGLYRSHTYHNEWQSVPNVLGTMVLTDIEALNNVLYALAYGILYRSTDFGTTFEQIPAAGNGSFLFGRNNKVFIVDDTEIRYSADEGSTWQSWVSGINDVGYIYCADVSEEEDATVVGGFVGPWNPVPYLKMFTAEHPEGIDIRNNLPLFMWHGIENVVFYDGKLFICPSSGGLWYRDDLAVGIKDNKPSDAASYSQLSIYPNPAKDIIRIHHDKNIEKAEYQVIDYSGKLIMKGKIETGMDHFSLDVSNLSDGIYLIMIRDNDIRTSGKFIKTD